MARVLIVDDERDLATICRFVLESVDHVVECVETGDQAIGWAIRERPDVIVLDWVLPDMMGDEVLRALRKREELSATAILVTSALPGLGERAWVLGADGFLPKPFEAEELLRAVGGLRRRSAPAQP